MTDAELRALAIKIVEGRVVAMWNVPQDLWLMVFMPLGFMTKADLRKHTRDTVYAIRGEDTSVPGRAINGYPMFASCRFLPAGHFARVNVLVDELRAQRTAFLTSTVPSDPAFDAVAAGVVARELGRREVSRSGQKKVTGVPRNPRERGVPTKAQQKQRPRKRRTPR